MTVDSVKPYKDDLSCDKCCLSLGDNSYFSISVLLMFQLYIVNTLFRIIKSLNVSVDAEHVGCRYTSMASSI